MDPRRLLIFPLASVALGACAIWPGLVLPGGATGLVGTTTPAPRVPTLAAPVAGSSTRDPGAVAVKADDGTTAGRAAEPEPPPGPRAFATMAPIPNPRTSIPPPRAAAPRETGPSLPMRESAPAGRAAIAAANLSARETSRARAFLGGVQVFVYDPGRVYEVWTAPLRVTTLTLSPGESVVSKAAGDTVRWQIGETQSGEGQDQRAHVMIKPLQRGLETNLVLATSRRVYLLQLRSGAPETFNAAVTWDLGAVLDAGSPAAASAPPPTLGLVTPQGPLDAGFRIKPKGRRPAWTPTAVVTDGVRTFLTFPPGLIVGEAPALFVLSPRGEAQLVNYRQQGGLWVVDQVLRVAELRLGGRKAQVVRIERTGAPS